MIAIDGLVFRYGDGPELFSGFSLHILRGEAWTIIGPSGCGKTTLLSLVAGMAIPESGTICVAGEQIVRARPRTGLVLQDHGLLPWATVLDNARLGLKIRNHYGPDGIHSPKDMETDEKTLRSKVDYWLEWLGISHLRQKFPAELSMWSVMRRQASGRN